MPEALLATPLASALENRIQSLLWHLRLITLIYDPTLTCRLRVPERMRSVLLNPATTVCGSPLILIFVSFVSTSVAVLLLRYVSIVLQGLYVIF